MKTVIKKPRLLQVHAETTDYEIRVEEVRDKQYWVVPVVMMVEGVHHGSRGPLLYTEEELAASIGAWNGMPVTIGHPQDEEGTYISANEPGVLEGIVGRIYNAKMKEDKLTAECWIDITSLKTLSEEAFEYIEEKKALDVSVGVFSKEVKEKGEYEGEEYRAVAVNIIPDHLALLPGETGACSWNDGCGIRTNSKNNMKTNKTKDTKEFDKAAWLATLLERNSHLIANETSFGDIIRNLHDQVGRTDNDSRYTYVEEVFDDYFIYCVVNRATGDRALYKREYTVQEDGSVTLDGTPVKVRRDVSFVTMKLQRTKFSNNKTNKMKTNKKKPCTCTVDSLIQNKASGFTEDDREYLESLSQERLDKFAPVEEEEEEETPVANKKPVKKVAVVNNEEEGVPLVATSKDGKILINGKGIDEYVKESLTGEKDPVKLIDNFFPGEIGQQMKAGLKTYQEHRAKQIKDITANAKSFKEEQLKGWSDEDLNALHATVMEGQDEDEGGNYAPLAGGSSDSGNEDDVEAISAMMSFATPKEKKEDTAAKK